MGQIKLIPCSIVIKMTVLNPYSIGLGQSYLGFCKLYAFKALIPLIFTQLTPF